MAAKIKIVLDADVLIHFSKGEKLSLLPNIFPNYELVVLSPVHEELRSDVRTQVENLALLLNKITLEVFRPNKEIMREYALLQRNYGKGESACMAYCRFTQNVIGSSNLRDIKEYCVAHRITHLTTIDFLAYAVAKELMTAEEANNFVMEVTAKNSKLPTVDFRTYRSPVELF